MIGVAARPITWAILSGEYPPASGGVGDYAANVARALAITGDEVHVFAPASAELDPDDTRTGVNVHGLADRFGADTRRSVARAVDRLGPGARVLVHYVPHAFGLRAMNLPFCAWIHRRCRRWRVGVMFHEVAFPLAAGQPLRHNVLGLVTRVMAWTIARAAIRHYASTTSWEASLRRLVPPGRSVRWLPIGSNLPLATAHHVAATRERLAPGGELIVGHFGTYGPAIVSLLSDVVIRLAGQGRRIVLLGRGSLEAAAALGARSPATATSITATGELPAASVAAHVAACDVLLQPYPDGLSARRSSLMAALAIGRPVVSAIGPLSEAMWGEPPARDAVVLATSNDPSALATEVEQLLANAPRRALISRSARELYEARFALRHVVATLREDDWR